VKITRKKCNPRSLAAVSGRQNQTWTNCDRGTADSIVRYLFTRDKRDRCLKSNEGRSPAKFLKRDPSRRICALEPRRKEILIPPRIYLSTCNKVYKKGKRKHTAPSFTRPWKFESLAVRCFACSALSIA